MSVALVGATPHSNEAVVNAADADQEHAPAAEQVARAGRR